MSYTTNRQPQGILKNPKAFLEEGLISEIVAINDYSSFLSFTDNKEIKEIFHHIMKEEKEHYGLFLKALRSMDEEQEQLSEKVKKHVQILKKNNIKDLYSSKNNKHKLLDYIREAIKGELEAILLYQYFIENISDENLIDLIKKIIKDEKEHLEELTKVMLLLDQDQYGPLES